MISEPGVGSSVLAFSRSGSQTDPALLQSEVLP